MSGGPGSGPALFDLVLEVAPGPVEGCAGDARLAGERLDVAGAAGRLTREAPRRIKPCRVPVGVAVFAHDITLSVRPLAERLYDISYWSEFERGGHFAAMEVPELFAEDVRDFFLTLTDDLPVATR